jgi:hypothetical protein
MVTYNINQNWSWTYEKLDVVKKVGGLFWETVTRRIASIADDYILISFSYVAKLGNW